MPYGTRGSDVAFDSKNNVYLAVSSYGTLRGRFVTADGNLAGDPFVIQSSGNYTHFPRVAYSPDANSGNGAFLVTWHESDGTMTSVHSRLVGYPGSLLGTEQKLSANDTWWEAGPAVAYGSGSKQFLVVWRTLSPNDVKAIHVNTAGAAVGSVFPITTTGDGVFEDHTSVTYNPSADEFMVLHADYTTFSTLRAQRVKGGALVGGAEQVATATAIFDTDIQYNVSTGNYLAVWYQDPPKAIYGTLLSPSGTPSGSIDALSSRYRAYDAVSMALNPVSNSYFIISHDSVTSEDGGVEVNSAGTPLTTGIQVTAAGGANFYPRLAANINRKEWLAVASNAFTSTIAQRLATSTGSATTPTPTPAPTPTPTPVTVGAVMTSPSNLSSLTSGRETFTWTTGTGVSRYHLYVGSAVGGSDIYDAAQGTSTSTTISNIPTDGRRIYVRLYSEINGTWSFVDYSYVAANQMQPASLVTPADGATLDSATVFTWTRGSGVTDYWLDVGTTKGAYDILSQYQGTSTSTTVQRIPSTGGSIWVRLYSRINGSWHYSDSQFGSAIPRITYPAAGTTFDSSAVTFRWNAGTGVTDYWLTVGTALGAYDVYSASQGTSLMTTLNNLPLTSQKLYVRLYSRINGTYCTSDTTFTAAPVSGAARMVSPAPAAVITQTTTFMWGGSAADSPHWLDIGTSRGGYDIYSVPQGQNRSVTVVGIPFGGYSIWVRLWTRLSSGWTFVDYRYESADSALAQLISPLAGSRLNGTVTFNWSAGAGATAYWLDVGTTQGSSGIYTSNPTTSQVVTVANIPTDGKPVWVRLWSRIGGTWYFIDYQMVAGF